MFREIDELLLSSKFIKQKGYWLNKLTGITDVERTELLFKSTRNRKAEEEIEKIEILIPGDLLERLMKLGKQSDLSIYIILLAVLKLLIYRYTNREDVTVMSPLFQRNIGEEILNDQVYIRDTIAGEAPFTDLLLAVRQSVLGAYENQDYPSGKLIEYIFGAPVDNSTLVSDPLTGIGCLLSNIHDNKIIETFQDKDSLIFYFHRKADGIDGYIRFNRDVYEEGYVRLASQHFTRLLGQCLQNVKKKISSVFFTSKEEERQLVVDFNQTPGKYPGDKTLVELFAEQAAGMPEKIAVVGSWQGVASPADNGAVIQHLTYKELNRKSDQLAHLLGEKGVKPGTIVGLMAYRSIETVIGILGILKAGGAFLPIDADHPQERIDYMLKDSRAKILLSEVSGGTEVIDFPSLIVDNECSGFTQPTHLCYVIYTSGTSGKPKGVMISHRAIVNYIWWAAQTYVGDESMAFPFYTSISFDLTLTSLFTPLVTGNTIVVYGEEEKALLIGRIIEDNRVGVVKLTPSHLKLLIHVDKQKCVSATNIKCFIVGGEKLEKGLALEIYYKFNGNIEIYNEYGPTEAAVGCMIYRFDSEKEYGGTVPIGYPINNIKAYIVDRYLNPLPFGAAGELCIGGAGLAKGYLNRPVLTEEKFDQDLWDFQDYRDGKNKENYQKFLRGSRGQFLQKEPPGRRRLYKTGDLARRFLDGSIEFLGRLDSQVKIRGYRVEPGEIENHLLKHEKVKAAVITTMEMEEENKYLCAYIVSEDELESSVLREYLLRELPVYMIPSYFVRIDKIPLTLNGKVDMKALPRPELKSTSDYVPPRDALEKKLVEIWAQVLGVERDIIGIDSNFFELGGQSLKATILAAKIHKALDIELPLTKIFSTPTIRGLGEYVRGASRIKYSSIDPVEEKEFYVVSSVQRRLFFLQQLEPANMSYNMPYFIAVEGDYDPEKFKDVFGLLIKRHESFRTSFEVLNGEPVQRIHEDVNFEIEYYELATKNAKDHEEIIRNYIRPFSLSNPPLLRMGLIIRDKQHMTLMTDMHHIISDGISQSIMESDFMAYYRGENQHPLRIQYKDFAWWLHSKEQQVRIKRQGNYWLKRFAGEIPLLELPVDFERPLAQTFEGKMAFFDIGAEMGNALRALATDTEATLYMVLLAIFNVMLSQLCRQEDIIVGTSLAGRNHSDLQGIMGMFINALALRNYPSREKTFRDFLVEVRQNTLDDFANQDYQFEDLVDQVLAERIPGRTPLFDVMMVLNNEEYPEFKLPGLKLKSISYEKTSAQMDLKLRLIESSENIVCNFEYSSRLFSQKTIDRFIDYFKMVVSSVVKDPNANIGRIEMMTREEKLNVLEEFNRTGRSYDLEQTLYRLVEEQAARTPGHAAVVGHSAKREAHNEDLHPALSYRELNEKANRLARLLRKKGVGKETVVGIMMEPGVETIISLLAILKAGGAYLPIDVGVPEQRVRHMLDDTGVCLLLTTGSAAGDLSFTALRGCENRFFVQVTLTPPRRPSNDFDNLPRPDRSLIDLRKYKNKIGMASVMDCISLQATRGCPYECLFCHKVWSKHHVFRSAENIFAEVHYYYRKGVRNFTFIDDCFNLNRENSSRFFKLLLENKLDMQIFFPNGLRGDLLTPDYIDLMVEAGTRGINLSLETASSRLQKLIRKHLDLDKFKKVMDYITRCHPEVILEIATMHGFPTETEEEAIMTLDFIKGIKWLHFPYIHILKIYPNTEMEAFALEHGVSKINILASRDLAFHELPETLPFPKSFTREYQSDFMNNYFLLKERLMHVMPVQLEVMGEAAVKEKYNTYLPIEIRGLHDILDFARLGDRDFLLKDRDTGQSCSSPGVNIFNMEPGPGPAESPSAKKILFLDLSQHFSGKNILYNVVEQPLGEIYLLTYLKQRFGDKITGRIYKAGNDFDSYEELKSLVDAFRPDLVGIRALTFHKEFFHETASMLRQWGMTVPIIAGGPYATSDYHSLLKDPNVNLAVLGEGEYTLAELIRRMLDNEFRLPDYTVLQTIPGIAFSSPGTLSRTSRTVLFIDRMMNIPDQESVENLEATVPVNNPAYVMYTSGSTGTPKGVMVEHRQVGNCICWMQEKFNLSSGDAIAHRTNLGFDPSVWEIFWPLSLGGKVKVLNEFERKDAEYLLQLMGDPGDLTLMYCTASLVGAMSYLLRQKTGKPRLTLPWLLIGAEPIAMDTVKHFYTCYEGKIVNTYGPTEGAINNTYYDLSPEDPRYIVPIGKPIANNKIYILSQDFIPVPLNVTGEICITGDSVVRGYINNPELTAGKFDHDFWDFQDYQDKKKEGKKREKIYKTGDIGRWLEDGNIEIMGRIDEQVKIRGHRIEIGEIEAAFAAHPDIVEGVVVVRDRKASEEEVRTCKMCGITSSYPGVRVNEDSVCEVCESFTRYNQFFDGYFMDLEDLKQTILEANRDRESPYHCLLLYAGGRGAGCALYHLVDMGLKVLAVTYDNGYFSKKDIEDINKITDSLGVDHVVLSHEHSSLVLKESMESANTVCRGCFHVSSSLGVEYAYRHGIPVVVGATLSRGQIIENKLFMFLAQGITEVHQLEEEVIKLQRSAPEIDKTIYDLIGIDIINNKTAYEKVKTLDFYRFCNITNEEMIRFLNNRDSYWKTCRSYAVYSTNCPIKQIGDYAHLKNTGYHYYGSATSWEKRLGHITPDNVGEDLQCHVTRQGYENFLSRIGTSSGKTVRKDEKYLAAYYVSQEELDAVVLRRYLSEKLPPYMIPSYFVRLQEIPLSSSGKIDRKKLPAPALQVQSGSEYIKPSGDIQEALAFVFHEVLDIPIDRIGIDDNFFELGGDSIKAIQITAHLMKQKLKLEISQFFLNPTIRKLVDSGVVHCQDRRISQDPVEGEVPLTPIQHQLFRENTGGLHHFNQSVMVYRKEGFDENYIKKVFAKIVSHHDALRMVFKRDEKEGEIIQFNRVIGQPLFDLKVFDLDEKGDTEIENVVLEHAQRIQQSIDLASGPVVKLGLFNTGPERGDHLLIVIHHLVIDGISWRILLEDFEIGYVQAREGIDINFQDKTDSFKFWSEKLMAYSQTEEAFKELEYWNRIEEGSQDVQGLPKDYTILPGERKLADIESAAITLNAAETEKLLKDVHKAFNTEINDILLTALGLAVKEWAAVEKVLIKLEAHGREPIMEGIDISRTIGWFTTQFPVLLDMSARKENELSGPIKTVKETLRQIPHRGIGYGILRYLTPEEKMRFRFRTEPEILFNYMGQLGSGSTGIQESGNGGAVSQILLSQLPKGDDRSPEMTSECAIMINGGIANRKLGLFFTSSKKEFKKETIEALANGFKSHLTRLINYCAGAEDTERTISDFDAVGLDAEEMDAIYDELELE
jgi:amino acid adenylation domain-containing protein/non-ribosomal peptide synthase protein (TIGR01720 family)